MNFSICYTFGLLAVESSEVIRLRMWRICAGGAQACDESILMVSEKLEAAREMNCSLAEGGTLLSIVERYRGHVAANAERLRASFMTVAG